MISYAYEVEDGFVLTLRALQDLLKEMSDESMAWAAVPVPHTLTTLDGQKREYVAVGFSIPDPGRVGHCVSFLFPLLTKRTEVSTVDNLLVCFHPKSASPFSQGLYPEDGEMKLDFMEDWDRFWTPLKERLLALEREVLSASLCPPALEPPPES